ncbi:hypothetical protein GNY06_09150 [Elizabethkingia argentiflava]|uniref:DUF3820 family protein n=1 Tax=Elizabethkingia argenteiflava TaxID=2681556 RepID=A0A845PYV0_9FLAO|nr:DUF3820 family protein [Elizabethkingia argenteiflava]NAW51538.1 hypothetical protein [Elizabethkingia argenteiflava]
MDTKILEDIVTQKMPFGKHKGDIIADLPMHYLEWFHREGMPSGKLGMWLSTVYEIKLNGLDYLLVEIRKHKGIRRTN